MPELPEVETTLRAVAPILSKNLIRDVEVLRKNMIGPKKGFIEDLRGRSILSLERRGKYLLVHLQKDLTLILHLKMSGRLGLRKKHEPPLTYERIRFHLKDDQLLIFNDPRTLGRALLVPTKDIDQHPSLKKLGPDALTISETDFLKRLGKKKGILKSVLLDQTFVAGIGNIYADESCFVAGIDPRRRVATLTKSERKALYKAIRKTLQKGIRNMGTSFSDFADLFGKPGKNQKKLFVYGRGGKPCLTCETTLKRTTIGQRGTVWCPHCQS